MEELALFYKSYKLWLEKGAPEGDPYRRGAALCSAISAYCTYSGVKSGQLKFEQCRLFYKHSLSLHIPFNETMYNYTQESKGQECHLNPARIAWVNKYAKG